MLQVTTLLHAYYFYVVIYTFIFLLWTHLKFHCKEIVTVSIKGYINLLHAHVYDSLKQLI